MRITLSCVAFLRLAIGLRTLLESDSSDNRITDIVKARHSKNANPHFVASHRRLSDRKVSERTVSERGQGLKSTRRAFSRKVPDTSNSKRIGLWKEAKETASKGPSWASAMQPAGSADKADSGGIGSERSMSKRKRKLSLEGARSVKKLFGSLPVDKKQSQDGKIKKKTKSRQSSRRIKKRMSIAAPATTAKNRSDSSNGAQKSKFPIGSSSFGKFSIGKQRSFVSKVISRMKSGSKVGTPSDLFPIDKRRRVWQAKDAPKGCPPGCYGDKVLSEVAQMSCVSYAVGLETPPKDIANYRLLINASVFNARDNVAIYHHVGTGTCALGFSGTKNMDDARDDMNIMSTNDLCDLEGVHSGFAGRVNTFFKSKAFKAFSDILADRNKCKKNFFTGFSLGGALASLTAACSSGRASKLRFKATKLYTFGSPRVSTKPLFDRTYDAQDDRTCFDGLRVYYHDGSSVDPFTTIPMGYLHPKIPAVRIHGSLDGKREPIMRVYGCSTSSEQKLMKLPTTKNNLISKPDFSKHKGTFYANALTQVPYQDEGMLIG